MFINYSFGLFWFSKINEKIRIYVFLCQKNKKGTISCHFYIPLHPFKYTLT